MSQRFSVEGELNRIDAGLMDDSQAVWGATVEWFRYAPDTSGVDDVYDVGASRDWLRPLLIPCLWVVREEGADTYRQEGRYTADSLQFAVAATVFRDRLHWLDINARGDKHIQDRVRYEGKVFTITNYQVQGQLLDRDTIIGVRANEVRDDQLVFDPDFAPTKRGSGDLFTEGSLLGAGLTP